MKEQNAENRFEKVLAEKANGFRMNPSAKVWENVQSQISKERKRRVAIWWFSLTVLLMAGGVAYFIGNNKPMADNSKNQIASVQPEKIIPQQIEQTAPVYEQKIISKNEKNISADATTHSDEESEEISSSTETYQNLPAESFDINKEEANNATSSGNYNSSSENIHDGISMNSTSSMKDSTGNNNIHPTDADVTVHHHMGFYHRLSVVGEISPLVSFRTLHSQGFNDSLVKIRNQNDQVFMGMAYKAALRYDLSKTIVLSGGISYSRTGEGISVSKTYSGYNDSTVIGNPFVATDSMLQYGTDYLIVNRYNYLEVPVDMEVTFKSYKTNEFSFNVGAAYEMLKQVQSPFYDITSNPKFPVLNSTSTEVDGLRNQNIKIFGGLNYRNEISNHFIFTGGIQMNMMLLNLFPSSYPLNEKPYWGGIKGGLIYHF